MTRIIVNQEQKRIRLTHVGGATGGSTPPFNGGTITNDLTISKVDPKLVIQDTNDTLTSHQIGIKQIDGINTVTLNSNAQTGLQAPTIALDSQNIILTKVGGEIGNTLVVAGLTTNGYQIIGYGPKAKEIYSEYVQSTTPVTIKTSGGTINNTVNLGLAINISQHLDDGTSIAQLDVPMINTSIRTGTVEFGLRANGNDFWRNVKVNIPANFNNRVATSVQLLPSLSDTDVIELICRVTEQSNQQFNLTMNATTELEAIFRIYAT